MNLLIGHLELGHMNIYLAIIIIALIGKYAILNIADHLNLKSLDTSVPNEFQGFYDEEKYKKAQEYTIIQTRFEYVTSTIYLLLLLPFIILGGFNYVDGFVRGFHLYPLITGLIFFGILYFTYDMISIPFSLYHNFVIEEKFGFNQMTLMTFIMDKLKSYVLAVILGSFILGGILLFFEKAGAYAWLYAWALVSFFILIAQPLYTILIAPMFNKFMPLENGKLKEKIEGYTRKVNFPIKEVSVMDGSKRSTHSNAYFSGIFKKRIALFDTLIKRHTPDELVAVIAHEVGHYKRHHIFKRMVISILHAGILLFLLSFFIKNRGLFDAFRMEQISVYGGIVFFGLLYSPIETFLSVLMNHLSRKYEYEADRFAVETTNGIDGMILALKNLSVANLTNLTPHPLNVILNYTHPPVLARIKSIRALHEKMK